jgi:hypothetical protein
MMEHHHDLGRSGIEKIDDFFFFDNLLDDIFPLGQTWSGCFDDIAEGIKYPVHLFIVYYGEFMLIDRVF